MNDNDNDNNNDNDNEPTSSEENLFDSITDNSSLINDNKLIRKDDFQNKLKILANQIIKIKEDEIHSNNKVYNSSCQRSTNNTVPISICCNQINDNISMVSFNDLKVYL